MKLLLYCSGSALGKIRKKYPLFIILNSKAPFPFRPDCSGSVCSALDNKEGSKRLPGSRTQTHPRSGSIYTFSNRMIKNGVSWGGSVGFGSPTSVTDGGEPGAVQFANQFAGTGLLHVQGTDVSKSWRE